MISTSDIIILTVASAALAVGIYRWHGNTQDVSSFTIEANSQYVVESDTSSLQNQNTLTAANGTNAQTDITPVVTPVVVQTLPETTPVTNIVVPTAEQPSNPLTFGSHRVISGDYLGKIANQYGTDVQTLRDINGISGNLIQIGDEILYPL